MPIKKIIEKIKTSFKRPAPTEQIEGLVGEAEESKEAVSKPIEVEPKKKFSPKIIFTAWAVIAVVLVLVLTIVAILKKQKKEEVPLPLPTPTPAEEEIVSPSAYATDSAVLKFEEDLNILESDLLQTDLSEASLNPPVLDMDVNFEE